MTDRNDEIAKLFRSLSAHSDLIAQALDSNIEVDGSPGQQGVDELARFNALRPYENQSYYLNSRLREFIADYFVAYNPFQTLTRITEAITRARAQFEELLRLKEASSKDALRHEWALDNTVSDIVSAIDRNLTLLNAALFTQYGNVEGLDQKLRQNRFYSREVDACLRELVQVDRLVQDIKEQALNAGLLHIQQLVSRRMGTRLLGWVSDLRSSQAEITKRLFLLRQMEQRPRTLAAVALWLTQHPARAGFEMDIDETASVVLLRPEAVRVRSHIDVRTRDAGSQTIMATAAQRLPAPRRVQTPEERVTQAATAEFLEQGQVTLEVAPEDAMLELLAQQAAASGKAVSMCQWKQQHAHVLGHVTEEEWLLYGSSQLYMMGMQVEFVMDSEHEPMPINRRFRDAIVVCA